MSQSGPEQSLVTGCRRRGQIQVGEQAGSAENATIGRAVGDRGDSDTRGAGMEFQVFGDSWK